MTPEEIKKGRSVGATHYLLLGIFNEDTSFFAYYMAIGLRLFVFDCGEWVSSEYLIHQMDFKPLP